MPLSNYEKLKLYFLQEYHRHGLPARYAPKFEKIYADDDKLVLKDNVKNRIAEVAVQRGVSDYHCKLCDKGDCVHVTYVTALPNIVEALNVKKIKPAK